MANLLFDRETLKCTGYDRQKQPFEVEILNVNVEGLAKSLPFPAKKEKVDELGNPLYLLPQPDLEIIEPVSTKIKTEEVTDEPVMVTISKKVPIKDEAGTHMFYYRTRPAEVLEDTGEPVMITKEVEGQVIEEQKTDDQGRPLFWGTEEYGDKVYCYRVEKVEEQEVVDGQLLYFKTLTDSVTRYEAQPTLEITEEDENYVEGLPRALEDTEYYRSVKFEEEFPEYSYTDIVDVKEKQILVGKIYEDAILFETMDNFIFPNPTVNTGFDFISIPTLGSITTAELLLPSPSTIVGIYTETNVEGLSISVGTALDDLQLLDRNKERTFTSDISTVFVKFENTTDKAIDLYSFAIMTF